MSNDTTNETPYGYCHCGCGQKTTIASRNKAKRGQVKGHPVKYIAGHGKRKHPHVAAPDPSGLCQCGCGQLLPTQKFPSRQRRFIDGHQHQTRPPAERFWEKVDRRGPNDCWPWQGGGKKDGYGSFYTGERLDGAHRFSYELNKGPITDGLWVLHKCDNPRCVNPDHLFLGTQTDNMQDCSVKGRAKGGPHLGTDNINAKLTEDAVRDIRQRYAGGEIAPTLALEYGVSHPAIYAVIHRRTWKHVT